MVSLKITRRGINRILLCCGLLNPLFAAEPESYLTAIDGVYSFASSALPASLNSVYSGNAAEYNFTDYGGRFYFTRETFGFGFSLGLYSAFNARALLNPTSQVSTDFIARKNAETGSAHAFASGNYRLGQGWVPLQFRFRKTWFAEWVFTEIGTGPAYGFGALEYTLTATAGGVSATETRYHKYSEWGWMSSIMLGIDVKLSTGLSLQIFTEGAWLYARVRNPDLLQSNSVTMNQLFFRPGIAVAFRF